MRALLDIEIYPRIIQALCIFSIGLMITCRPSWKGSGKIPFPLDDI
jgi:hypothetical protein